MKKNTVLVLGVGNAQVDLIQYLKTNGWFVIGCSYRPEGRGLAGLDEFVLLDVLDVDGIEQFARNRQVDLIYTIGSDLAMPTVSAVSATLGLPAAVPAEVARLLQNKLHFREFLSQRNLSPIKYHKVQTVSDLEAWSHFPAMIKPVDNQGQRGVFMATNLAEAQAGLDGALLHSRSRTLIIEEFLEGPEVSANTFLCDGRTVLNEISDRLVMEGYAGGLPKSHTYPAQSCTGQVLEATKTLVEACNQELGIQNGPVYYQLILTVAGPRIVEVTPRLDGCHMWRLIRTASGVDLLDACVRQLMGESLPLLDVKPDMDSYSLGFYYCPPGREFHLADYQPNGAVEHLEYYYAEGEKIRPINGYLEKVGYYIERLKN